MSQRETIARREEPMVLSRSLDPTKKLAEDTYYDGSPLRHRSAIYNAGTNGTHGGRKVSVGFGLTRTEY